MAQNTDPLTALVNSYIRGDWGINVSATGHHASDTHRGTVPLMHDRHGDIRPWKAGLILNEHAMLYVTDGEGMFESIPTGTCSISTGDALFLFPGVWHRYRPKNESIFRFYWVHFHGAIISALQQHGIITPTHPRFHCGLDDGIAGAFQELHDANSNGDQQTGPLAAAKTIELIARVTATHAPKAPDSRLSQIIRRARLVLEEEPDSPPRIDDMIKGFDISRTQFFRAFRRETGQSPYGYRLHVRMHRACKLLRNSDLPVKEIALSLGFNNPYHFSKIFKKKIGQAPRHYRQTQQNIPSRSGIAEKKPTGANYT